MIKIISQKLYIRVAISIALVAIVVSLVSSMLSYYSGFKEKKNTNYLLVQQLAQGSTNKKNEAVLIKLVHPFIEDTFIGVLAIYPDDNFIEQQAQSALIKEFILMLIQSIVIAFFVSLVVQRWLTQPIQNLTDSFAKINPSEPETANLQARQAGRNKPFNPRYKCLNARATFNY